MKKLFQRIDGISLRMLLSYLSILLVPLCVVVAIYFAAIDAILVSRQDTALTGLKETAFLMTARLEELSNISSYIYGDPNTNAIINRSRFESKPRNIYSFHQTIDALPNYKLTNQMIADVYIFFNEADFVIKQPSAFAFTEYNYASQVRFHGISYAEIRALCRQRFNGSLVVRTDAAGQDVLLLRSIPNSMEPDGLIVIQLETAMVDSILSTNDTGPGGGVYMLKDGQVISQIGGEALALQDVLALPDGTRQAYREIEHLGKRHLLCQVEEGGLTYLTLTEKEYLLANIAPIRLLITLLSAAAILVGVLICVVLWRRRRRVVKNIASTARSVGVEVEPAKSERHLLEATVNTLASTVDTLRETMDRQRDALRQTAVQACLTGTFPTRGDMVREVSSLNLSLFAPYYHVVRVYLLDPWEVRQESAQILPYRIFLKQFFTEALPIPHVISDVDGASFVILLTEQEEASGQALIDLFGTLSKEVGQRDWEIPSFAISDGCADLWDVRWQYRQTETITEYMALLERKGVLHTGDLPQETDAPYFPVDMEIRFIQTLKSGTVDELTAFFDGMFRTNLEDRRLNVEMLKAHFDALHRNILRALQEMRPQLEITTAMEKLSSVKSFAGLRAYALWAQEQMTQASASQSKEENDQMKEALIQAIEENLSNPAYNLYMLAESVGMNENTLYRAFKDFFGVSFATYLEQRRINRAFELLKSHVLIKDVAEMVGYTSDHTFRRAFKRVMKVPPGQFAKLLQNP